MNITSGDAVEFDLIAIRHGRTAWNASGRFQGHTDVALDDVGREQARRLGLLLAEIPISRAVASDLSRAFETATIALNGRGVAVATDPGWREMAFGAWEGLTWTEISERYPEASARTTGTFPQPVDGESFDALTQRIAEALVRVRRSASGGDNFVVATHAGPLHALLRVALGESEAAALAVRFQPATYTRIAFRRSGTSLVAINVGPADEPAAT